MFPIVKKKVNEKKKRSKQKTKCSEQDFREVCCSELVQI